MRFIRGEPALVFYDALVVADTHFGIEEKYLKKREHSFSWGLAEKLCALAKKHKKKKIFILGDVKDSIPSTPQFVADILRFISNDFEVWIAKGNHDGGLQKLKIKNLKIFPKGFIYKNAAFFHGHAIPPKNFLHQPLIFMSHGHLEYNGEKVWLISEMGKKKVIVVPSFNPIVGRNIQFPFGPLFRNKIFKWLPSKLYTLNGVLIGRVENIVNKI
ncbi:MAG: metallophosphoesterase [Candidatus Anstonellales archaeon]